MIRSSESVADISAAWVAAAKDMPNVPKQTVGQAGNVKTKYADLATLVDAVRPILAEHGLAYLQGVSDGDKVVTVTTRLVHRSGEWFEDSMSMPTGQNTPQAVGSATTYCRRYSLMALLGLAPDDDDGAAASAPAQRQQKRDAPASDTPQTISEAQTKKLAAAFGEFGVKERDERLRYLSKVCGRAITSSQEMTKAEASRAIDAIDTAIRLDREGAVK